MAKKSKKFPRSKYFNRKNILFIVILLLLGTFVFYKTSDIYRNSASSTSDMPVPTVYDNPIQTSLSPIPIDKTFITPIQLGNHKVAIPELGIKVTLPEGISDLIYFNDKSNPSAVYFSTTSLSKLGDYCVASLSPLGHFSKVNKSELTKENSSDNWQTNETQLKERTHETTNSSGYTYPPQVKEFKDFYIIYKSPEATCSDDPSAVKLQTDQSALLNSTIPSLEVQ